MGDVSILMYILFLVVLGSGIVIVLRTKGKPIPEPEHSEPMTFAEKKEMAGFVASTSAVVATGAVLLPLGYGGLRLWYQIYKPWKDKYSGV